MEFLAAVSAALPSHTFEPLNSRQDTYQLETAGLVTYQPSNRASNYTANGSGERRLEVRDFVRTAPIVEIDLSPAGETGLETSSEAMDILIFPQPPQGLPVLWHEPPVGFAMGATELGDLARLSFTTTGFAEEDESKESERHTDPAVEQPPAIAVAPQIHAEPKLLAAVEAIAEVAPEPVVQAAPAPEPDPEPVVQHVAEPVLNHVVEPVVDHLAEPAQPVPDAVTKPLPLVLHVATPSKGKPAQIFSSALNAVDVQVPRSTSLPLRPVMTIGPAPAKEIEKPVEKKVPERPAPPAVKANVKNDAKNDAKIEPKKPVVAPAPVRPDPRLVNAKLRRPTPEVQPAVKAPEPEPVKVAAPGLKQVAKTEIPNAPKPPAKTPEVREDVKTKEEPKPGPAFSYGSSDLGLPHLSMQPSPGFLGRLPVVAKIGIAVALLAGVGSVIAFSSKSGGAAVSSAPGTIVAGTTLPVGEAGWITDWGADTGVRRTRQISILRSSQTLTDYRIQMQGQIETKAIGWVFRAADPKNFYVTKLEIIKPGLEPSVAVVRFAVINGEEQAHAQLPLPMKVRRDTMYKIRFDAVGGHFTTYVQDQKVDDWTDSQIKSGGVGLYSERGEVMTLKGGMSVVPLIVQK
jgi:hypothetical protein